MRAQCRVAVANHKLSGEHSQNALSSHPPFRHTPQRQTCPSENDVFQESLQLCDSANSRVAALEQHPDLGRPPPTFGRTFFLLDSSPLQQQQQFSILKPPRVYVFPTSSSADPSDTSGERIQSSGFSQEVL